MRLETAESEYETQSGQSSCSEDRMTETSLVRDLLRGQEVFTEDQRGNFMTGTSQNAGTILALGEDGEYQILKQGGVSK